jgi:hypothetical protein
LFYLIFFWHEENLNIFCSKPLEEKKYHPGQDKIPHSGECMASVPIPGPGSIVIVTNMREARRQGMTRK